MSAVDLRGHLGVLDTVSEPPIVPLRLEDTYGAKIRPPLHVSLNNSVIRPSFKNLRDLVILHLIHL